MPFTEFDKAIVALVPGILAIIAAHFGFHLTADVESAIVTLVTAGLVYLVPNKE